MFKTSTFDILTYMYINTMHHINVHMDSDTQAEHFVLPGNPSSFSRNISNRIYYVSRVNFRQLPHMLYIYNTLADMKV